VKQKGLNATALSEQLVCTKGVLSCVPGKCLAEPVYAVVAASVRRHLATSTVRK
jgi:hypothetical protein